jgi:hypothetical protein
MRRICVSIALLALIAVLSQSTAQQPDPAVFKLFGAVNRIIGDNPGALASNQGVQKELKMDEDQVKAVREKIGGSGFGFGGGRGKGRGKDAGGDFKERFAKMMEKVEKLKDVPEDKLEDKIREEFKEEIETPTKEVEKILKPEQMKRLMQIARQQGGPRAYLKPENVKDLSINDDQKKKLTEIATELEKDVGELRRSGGGMGGFRLSPETREKIENLNKEAADKAAGVLTAEQKTKWKELIGEPFTVQRGGFRPKKDD